MLPSQTVIKGVLVKHEKESGKLKLAGGAWSINLDYTANKNVHTVIYITSEKVYAIRMVDAWDSGFERMLQGENKLIVPLKNWKVIQL